MPQRVTVQRVGTTLDLLLFRAYGRRGNTSAMLSSAYALNRGIARRGTVLPLLTPVLLPDLDTSKPATKRAAVNLFGDT
ncbi:tail protein X [Methylobacterium gnaphalii]|uniref:Tail protein X n=1 Tax=Methylobacterium gnaphalii TaxID=1010610 RepID=A0A512JPE6_9HYPH|nr:tail protein X [Methylobacterium gnaphalii]GEP11834.1 hypothetical protein MGN01_36790 [Methylobacterium gnaphalii]GJD69418.1 hypothetical protein MMMDOFMJ_2349 [Methylobacterium gnaphalii]GLS49626.1 hypothetical protein GCM10007885_24750 [Methylobacterium gnaphalii]